MRLAIALIVLGLAAHGCGDDSDPAAADGGTPGADGGEASRLSDVIVSVTYEGDLEGALVVGAFTSDPPTSAPLAFQQRSAPEFPESVRLRGLEPGTYYVTAVLDLTPASPTLPGPEDATVTSDPLVVDGEPSHEIALTLTDP